MRPRPPGICSKNSGSFPCSPCAVRSSDLLAPETFGRNGRARPDLAHLQPSPNRGHAPWLNEPDALCRHRSISGLGSLGVFAAGSLR